MKQSYHFLFVLFLICFTTKLYSQSVPSYVPTNGLVGWWGFNGNAQDGSVNGNHGTVNGATLTTDRFGNQNGAYSFDGIDDRIDLPLNLNGALLNLSQFTLTGFILKNSTDERTFFSNWKSFPLSDPFGVNCAIGPGIKAGNCSGTGVFTTNHIISGEWYYVSIVFDGLQSNALNRIKLFINGYQQLSDSGLTVYSPFVVSSSLGNQATHTAFGSHFSQFGWWAHLDGKLDNIGIWNRALTQQEITNLYNSQLPTQTSLCLPTITTNTPTSIGIDSVVIGGDILNDGGSSIVLRGICYSTTPNPNMGNPRTEEGSGIGSFTSTLRNLSPSTNYYVRSYAKNSQGVVVYGNEVSFSTGTPTLGIRCPGTPSVTDIDGNIYHTVQIGTQCWTQSNLKVSKYRNGDNIPTGLSNSAWENTTAGAYAIYNNDPVNDGLYGKLYNHYAVMDTRGLCPTGWHVPTDGEWTTLETFLGGSSVAGGALKSTATLPTLGGWVSPNLGATNSSGFTAKPASQRSDFGGFGHAGYDGVLWSSSISGISGWARNLSYIYGDINRGNYNRTYGFSVRCLRDSVGGGTSMVIPTVTTASVTAVTSNSATTGGDVTQDGGTPVTARGVAYGTSATPTTSGTITTDGTGTGVFTSTLTGLMPSTTYYVRAYATNSVGTAYGTDVSFITTAIPTFSCGTSTVSDVDGNNYNTVQIGTQCWTQSNLKVSKYRNGDSITTGLSNSTWASTTNGAFAIYNNNPLNDSLYGKLYNHYAVMDTRGMCPTGWHVPTDGEWSVLENFLGGYILSENAAEMLKGPAQGDWNRPNSGVTNSTGFTALPGGLRYGFGAFANIGGYSGFWSSSNTGLDAWNRGLVAGRHPIERSNYSRNNGFSIRCLKDSIIMPFSCGMSTISDIDGNNYNTVQIGMQCWTQSNLKVSKYRNGDNIPTGLSNSAWGSTTAGAYVIYDNNWPNFGLYGLLYNHFAVIDSRGLCPTGWHIPTDNEWNVLVKYLDPNSDTFAIGSQNTTAGGMLRSTLTQPTPGGWSSPNLGATNSSGFTAEPGGFRWQSYGMMSVGTHGLWWSSSISITEAWHRSMNFSDVSVSRNTNPQNNGFSVRCLRD
jgi:uncharacterized protein (TIGR02145 family)